MGNPESTNETDLRRSRWTVGRSVTVLAVMAALVPFVIITLRQLTLDNRVETWLPDHDPHKMVLDWFQRQFGDKPGLLVSWNGSSLNDPRVEAFADELSGPTDEVGVRRLPKPGISSVRTPRDLIRRMLDNDVDRDTAITELQGVVIGAGPLKVRLTAQGKLRKDEVVETIRRLAQDELGIEVTFLPPTAEQQTTQPDEDPVQSQFEANEFGGPGADDPYPLPGSHDFQLRWEAMTARSPTSEQMIRLCEQIMGSDGRPQAADCFFAPGAPVAVLVTMSGARDEQIEQALAEIGKAARRAGVPESDLHMGGSPYGRIELNRAAQGALWNPQYPIWNIPKRSPVITSAVVGVGLAFLVLRSVRLATLILLTDLFVAGVSTALLPATGHSMNLVLIVLPNLMIVVTSSGAIHIANYWKHEAAKRVEGAVSRAIKIGWQPCILASMTTAIGLTSLSTSVLRPVREFGVFAAIGCLIALGAVLLSFPSMLRLWKGTSPSIEDVDRSQWRRLGGWLYRNSTFVIAGCLVLFAVGIFGLQWFRTETKVIRYFPPEARIVHDYRFLEENLAGIAPVEVVVSFDDQARADLTSVERMEMIREVKDVVGAHPEISGTLALSDFRPPLEVPSPDASRRERILYNRTVHEMDRFLAEVAQEEEAEGESEGRQDLVTFAPERLSARFGERQVEIPQGAELWRIRAQVALMTDLDYGMLTADLDRILSQALAETPGTTHVVTGMVPLFLRTQNAVVESLVESFGLAFAAIAVVMMILLRQPLAGLITMLPNLLPVILVFGLISLAGVPVDIGTMITASVALGLAVDDSLHQLTWFREGLKDGLPRQEAISRGLAHCGPAMAQTSAVVGLGLLMLAWTDLLLVSRFGWLMAAMVASALAADIIFLPALLAGPLGSLIERGLPRPPSDAQSTPSPKSDAAASMRDRVQSNKPLRAEQR